LQNHELNSLECKKELGDKDQDNYYTDKADWQRGLESLIEELKRIAAQQND
jgi:hypothetical protein